MGGGDCTRWPAEATLLGLVLAVLAIAPATAAGVGPTAALGDGRADTLRVLFVGNSYSYYNNLPALLEALAAAQADGPVVQTGMVAAGGASLLDHLEGEEAVETIRSAPWDVVVLQEQSSFGTVYLVDGQYRPVNPVGLWEASERFREEVETMGARTILMEHWRRREAPERDARMIHFAFDRLGREPGVDVAPVGPAFEASARWGFPRSSLYDADGSHPGPPGSWLAAAVLYEVLTGSPPDALPGELRGAPVDPETGRAVPDSVVALVSLGPGEAARLGAAAREATRTARAAAVAPPATDPGRPSEPTPPPPVPLPDPGVLEGRWTGPLTVYPYPGTLVLELERAGETWSAEVTVTFGGRPDDIHVAVDELSVEGSEIRFVDPDGPNGGRVEYRGVWTGPGLDGIAEIVVPGSDLYGVGRWCLRRPVQPPRPTNRIP